MEEKILEMARLITGAGEEEKEYLAALCRAEQEKLRDRLREESLEQSDAFLCAAAWMAAADYCSGKGAGGAASWRAGDVSVQETDAQKRVAAADALRAAGARLLEGLVKDDAFAFWGVRG